MESATCTHNNGHLFYESAGTGEPLVLVHGFTLDHRMWKPQVAHFAGSRRVITYDARGFGASSLPSTPYSHVEDLVALLDHANVERAHFAGLSMGGRIAINLALSHPDRVQSLTLIDSALDGYPNEVDWNVFAMRDGLARAKQRWLDHHIFDAARKHPTVQKELADIIADYSGWHWLNEDTFAAPSTNARERLHEIETPTLVMVGEYDLPYFQNIASTIAHGIPDAQFTIIPSAGHMSSMEAPVFVNSALATFLNENRSASTER